MKLAPAPLSPRIFSIACILLLVPAALVRAQDVSGTTSGSATSRLDISGAYGYLKPFDSAINSIPYATYPAGAVGSAAFYFKPHLGIQVEGNYFPHESNDQDCVYSGQAGPIFRFQKGRFVPFVHILAGGVIVGGPAQQPCRTWGYGGTGGAGLDYVLPFFHNHLAIRILQVDMTYSHVVNPVLAKPSQFYGGVGDLYAVRGSAGFTIRFGDMHPAGQSAPMLSCSADPGDPYAGDPVNITSSLQNSGPQKDLDYVWEAAAGHLTLHGASASVDTTGISPGTYPVTGHLVRGPKRRELASCTTSFTVRVVEPPTLTCSTDRAAINSGDPVLITAKGLSSQNRPLIYTYTTTAGNIANNGPTASLATVGVTPGNITVTCRVTDDRNQSAVATASVVVATPAPPPPSVIAAANAQTLCGITFNRDRKRPDRVDNEAKACLDDVALTMGRATGAKLLVIGNHAPGESNQSAAERAMNAAQYLTDEKGIDGSRLDLRIGSEGKRSVSMTLLPPGATVYAGAGASFDTSSVHRTGQPYGRPGVRPIPRRRPRRKVVPKPVPPPT